MHHTSDAAGVSARAPDLDLTAAEFFRLLYPNADDLTGYFNLYTLPDKRSDWFRPTDLKQAAARAIELSESRNVYYGFGLVDLVAREQEAREAKIRRGERNPKVNTDYIRGSNSTIVAIPGFCHDADTLDPTAHKKTTLPVSTDDVLALYEEAFPGKPPTLAIASGRGVHGYWLLQEAHSIETAQERDDLSLLLARFQATINERGKKRHGWALDGTADLAHVFRPPETYNRKGGQPIAVTVLTMSGRRYDLEAFDDELIDVAWMPKGKADPVSLSDQLAAIDDLKALDLPPWTIAHIVDGNEEITDDDGKPVNRFKSDSEAVWRVVNELGERGHEDDTIAAILLDPRYGISAKPLRQRTPKQWVAAELGRMRRHQATKPPDLKINFNVDGLGERQNGHAKRNGATPKRDIPTDADAQPDQVSRPGHRPCTDLGNAERLTDRFGADVRYSKTIGEWLVWDGHRWKIDTAHRVVRLAKETVRGIYLEAAAAETKEERRDLAAWARRSEAAARIESMISLARSSVPIDPGELDRDPWLLNVRNGTVDLRDGRLRPHRREDLITKLIDVDYDPEAARPRWDQFLEEILPSESVRRFIKRAAGYSATGSARERKLIIGYGSGQNGKGVLLQTQRRLLGDYAVRTPSETFLTRKNDGIPNDIAQLRGARFVFASETNEGRRLGEATIKDLTGGEDISARFMRGEWFSFAPTFTPWLATNHRPEIKGTDHAVWDRIALVPFEVRIPEERQDRALAEKLEQELPGILAWLIEGAAEWYRDGLGVPNEVRDATSGYRRDMDTLADFLEERCILDPQAWVLAGKLYESYKEWIEAAGERPLSQKALGSRLSERGFKATRLGPKQARTWSGLRFRTADDPSPQTDQQTQDGSDTDSPFANGGKNPRVENPENPSDPSDPPDASDDDVVICETEGCMNAAPGPGLHCEACLNADVAEGVPW